MVALAEEKDGLVDEVLEREALAVIVALKVILGHPADHAIHRWVLSVEAKLLVLGLHVCWVQAVALLTWGIVW